MVKMGNKTSVSFKEIMLALENFEGHERKYDAQKNNNHKKNHNDNNRKNNDNWKNKNKGENIFNNNK